MWLHHLPSPGSVTENVSSSPAVACAAATPVGEYVAPTLAVSDAADLSRMNKEQLQLL